MSEAVQAWMKQAASHPAVSGCGVRGADRSFQIKSYRETLTEEKLTQAMRTVSEAAYGLHQYQIYAVRLRWKFDDGAIHCIIGPGNTMGVLVLNKETVNAEGIEKLLADCPLTETGS